MRVMLDANILISYLLPSTHERVISRIVESGVAGTFRLLVVADLITELQRKLAEKPYLRKRIPPPVFAEFVGLLLETAETVPPITEAIPPVTRDPKDDYLLAHALVGQADYLVTGDHDLLILGQVGQLRIVTPSGFVLLLESGF